MNDRSLHTVTISFTERGTFSAASITEPYFCFEAETEALASEKACRALDFYHDAKGRMEKLERHQPTLIRSRFRKNTNFSHAMVNA